jgi:hypothetical protein
MLAVALLSGASFARAASGALPGVNCSANVPSALNQYCEDIPSAIGARQAAPGSTALAATLPQRSLRTLSGPTPTRRNAAGRGRRSNLLALPAATRRELIPPIGAELHPNGWELFSALIAVIAALALAAAAAALLRRRRRAASP